MEELKLTIQSGLSNFENELAEEVRPFLSAGEVHVCHTVEKRNGMNRHCVTIINGGKRASACEQCQGEIEDSWEQKRVDRRSAKLACYNALVELTGRSQPWGSLTGVRPVNLLRKLAANGQQRLFTELYKVDAQKYELCADILDLQDAVIKKVPEEAICIYAAVPFCASRCTYCSFPARVAKKGEMERYVEAFERECAAASETVHNAGVPVEAIYLGGGTPTALHEPLFERVMAAIRNAFPTAKEFTLEAGRPDTINKEKLLIAKRHGVTRLCVNPQTMSNKTLELIGRTHTAEQIIDTIELARSLGFDRINMDIIAGLPGEDIDNFKQTLDEIKCIRPSALTCHTLSIKRGSKLRNATYVHADAGTVSDMVDMASQCAKEMGLVPYYLYRQKYMAGNLENVGYATRESACIYNIIMMEELRNVMAIGVGAVGKAIFQTDQGELIVRRPNPRELGVYLDRIDTICADKAHFFCVDKGEKSGYNTNHSDDGEE